MRYAGIKKKGRYYSDFKVYGLSNWKDDVVIKRERQKWLWEMQD